ncbi:MAG: UDP-3-O-[3-hydroxymyristoyl] N-acetylglucosamine deacetylase [Aquificae bacterium]|nr:UDP-3-O-[3-hydroxymyristoyl] N-acetylglucosamine deacetylase [Aquificota bacterium]
MFSKYQKTIEKDILIKGIGLHSGLPVNMHLLPAEENTGIIFIKNGISIPAHIDFANSFEFSTSLYKDGQWVKTIEHLLAALFFLEIDNLYILLDNEEIPILDGSAGVFIEKIQNAGIKTLNEEKYIAVLTKEVIFKEDKKYIKGIPSADFKVVYQADYNNNIIGNKKAEYIHSQKEKFKEIFFARTYCFLEEIEFLRKKGLAKGGSLENAVVIHNDSVLNPEGFRIENEPVKHKVLDFIGDLYLLGYPILGEFFSFKGGHKLNASFLKKMILEEAFELKQISEIKENKPFIKAG